MELFVSLLRWFKYNKKRAIPVTIITIWFLLFTSMKSSNDIKKAFLIVVILLIILLWPEIKVVSKKFISFYKKL